MPPPAPPTPAAGYVERIDAHLYRLQLPGPPPPPTADPAVGPVAVAPGYHPPGEVARRLYAWLHPAGGPDPLEPEAAAALLAAAHPSEAEVLAVVGLAVAVADRDPAGLGAKGERIRRAFGASAEFVKRVSAEANKAVAAAPLGQALTAARFVADLPRTVFEAVAGVVAATVRPRRSLDGLEAGTYQHPLDHAYQLRLTALPGSPLAGWFASYSGQTAQRMLAGRGFEVTEASQAAVARAVRAAAEMLGVSPVPRVFMDNKGFTPGVGGLVAAETFGTDDPCIQISQGAASALDPPELVFLLARQLGHIQAGHVRHRGLVRWLLGAANVVAGMTAQLAAPLVDFTLRPLLCAYYRATELTADRAGLLAAGREAALRVLSKQAGYPVRDAAGLKTRWMVEQALRRRAEGDGRSLVGRLLDTRREMDLEEPMATDRTDALLEWEADGGWAEVLDASPAQRRAMAARRNDDPAEQRLTELIARTLTDWAAGRFAVPAAAAGPVVRRMLYEQTPPDGPLAGVRHVELIVHARGVGRFEYELVALLLDGGKVFQAKMSLPYPDARDDAPAAIRNDFLRHGGPKTVRLLFPIRS